MGLAMRRVEDRARYARAAESSEQRETRLTRRRVADRVRYAADLDGRTESRRERHADERSKQRETQQMSVTAQHRLASETAGQTVARVRKLSTTAQQR